MESVKRYHVTETGLVEGQALGRINVVLGADFDRITAERDALQQRLTTADQRIDELEAAPVPPQGDAQPVDWDSIRKAVIFLGASKQVDQLNTLCLEYKATALAACNAQIESRKEVERLRVKMEDLRNSLMRARKAHASSRGILQNHIETLRTQLAEKQTLANNYCVLLMDANRKLAERDALLRDAQNLAMFTLPDDWHEKFAALSASAEPACATCHGDKRLLIHTVCGPTHKSCPDCAEPAAVSQKSEGVCSGGGEHGPWADNNTYCTTCGYYDTSRAGEDDDQ